MLKRRRPLLFKTLTTLALSAIIAAPAMAQSVKAGEDAFQSGDYATALENFAPLAEQGDAAAQLWLGSMYSTGYGVPEDDPQALHWIHASAHQGHVDAQVALGGIYFLGRDTAPDYVQSQMWMHIANANGFDGFLEVEESLKSFLTDAQAAEAMARARTCLASNYQDCD
jgi:TPR repeat protein